MAYGLSRVKCSNHKHNIIIFICSFIFTCCGRQEELWGIHPHFVVVFFFFFFMCYFCLFNAGAGACCCLLLLFLFAICLLHFRLSFPKHIQQNGGSGWRATTPVLYFSSCCAALSEIDGIISTLYIYIYFFLPFFLSFLRVNAYSAANHLVFIPRPTSILYKQRP